MVLLMPCHHPARKERPQWRSASPQTKQTLPDRALEARRCRHDTPIRLFGPWM